MKVLVACEYSGRVRDAFTRMGHEAMSCDLLPTESPGAHFQGDIREVLGGSWDMVLAFPPCTHLAVSGARYFAEKRADGRQKQGIEFFMLFVGCGVEKLVIENPIGIMSRVYRKPDQIIQPWQYGHPESKATCLWLRGVPLLRPTKILPQPDSGRWENQTPSGQNKLGPSVDRAKIRSATYQGIAEAMAEQWGGPCA